VKAAPGNLGLQSSANGMVRPCSRGQKNDFRDADANAEAVQRPTMKFVATKTADQLDLQALHRVRERLVSQRTGIINQIRAFLLERGIAVRQGLRFLRAELPGILVTRSDVLSPRMLRIVEELTADWRRLDERIEGLSDEIERLARQDKGCERLMTVPRHRPDHLERDGSRDRHRRYLLEGRDFGAWLGLVPLCSHNLGLPDCCCRIDIDNDAFSAPGRARARCKQ
jgi:transposase